MTFLIQNYRRREAPGWLISISTNFYLLNLTLIFLVEMKVKQQLTSPFLNEYFLYLSRAFL